MRQPILILSLSDCGPPRKQGLRSNSTLFWAPERVGVRQPILLLSALLQIPRTQRLRRNSTVFWAPDKARMRQPILILSRVPGTPENAEVA